MIPLRDDNPTTIHPLITVIVIISCVLVFLWQLSLGEHGFDAAVLRLGLIPAALFGHGATALPLVAPPLTVLSSMFLHGGWMHLIGNMLYLWIFGNNVEDAMGHLRFVLFYVACGVAAALAQALPHPESTIPMIGASGAISGVLGAYLMLYPRAQVLVLVPLGFYSRLIHLPAMIVLGFWFGLQLLNVMLAPGDGGGVAWGAHAGGFVAGMILVLPLRRRGVRLFNPPHRG